MPTSLTLGSTLDQIIQHLSKHGRHLLAVSMWIVVASVPCALGIAIQPFSDAVGLPLQMLGSFIVFVATVSISLISNSCSPGDPMVRVLEASNKTKGSVERLGLSFYLLFVGERSPE